MPPEESAVMLAELLALGLVGEYDVVAGRRGLAHEVTSVVLGTSLRQLDELPSGCLPVFPRERLAVEEVAADVALRAAHRRGLAGLVVERTTNALPEITGRLADRFGMALVLVARLDAHAAVAAVDRHLRGPRLAGLRMVDAMLTRLRQAPDSADGLLSAVRAAAGVPAAMVDGRGVTVAGDPATVDAGTRTELVKRLPAGGPAAPVTLFGDGHTLICHPATVADGLPANLWLVARLPLAGHGMVESVGRVLALGAWAYTAWIATKSLDGEREARYRAVVLADVVEYADDIAPGTSERATALGWRLSGWHVGIHLNIDQAVGPGVRPTSLIAGLERVLRDNDLPHDLVQRPGGWATWLTHDAEPEPEEIDRLARRLGHALRTFRDDHPGVLVAGGLGGGHDGAEGIGASLHEARQASLLARARGGSGAVETFGSMSVDRLLSGWQRSEPLLRATSSLLAPLREVDPGGDLVRTLMVYLDHESSATATANVLNVHRNTVLQRLERIRGLLPLDLSQPNDRLVAHLAARAVADEDT